MTDTASEPASKPDKALPKGAGNIWTDIGPVLAFVLVYNGVLQFPENNGALSKENAIFWGTGVFMVGVAAAIGWTLMKGRKLPPMLIITGVVVMVFGGLTLWLQDDTFIKMKPTIVNAIFAAILAFGLAQGRSYLRYLMGETIPLTERGWMIFTRRWVIFFVVCAVLNEFVWRTQTTDFWVTFKTFFYLPLTFVFLALQWPFLQRHAAETPAE